MEEAAPYCIECIVLVFPKDTPFPLPSETDLSVTRYAHHPHYRRLPDGSWWARFTRDELQLARDIANAITGQTEETNHV